MRDALKAPGHPAEVVILQPNEVHGFHEEDANFNLYTKMLAFFDKYIGPRICSWRQPLIPNVGSRGRRVPLFMAT